MPQRCVALCLKVGIGENVRREVNGPEFSAVAAQITDRKQLSLEEQPFLVVVEVAFMDKSVDTCVRDHLA